MEDNELKLIWKYDDKMLTDSLKVNEKHINKITKLKVHNLLASMRPYKLLAVGVGVVWVGIIGFIIANILMHDLQSVSVFFIISALFQIALTAIAIVVYVYQLYLINNIDFSKPVLEIQKKLTLLKVSTLNVARILFLQLPAWTTFYWNETMFIAENWLLWVIQGIGTLAFTFLAGWLFFNINYENRNKYWFQWIFKGKEWQPIVQAMQLLNQIERF